MPTSTIPMDLPAWLASGPAWLLLVVALATLATAIAAWLSLARQARLERTLLPLAQLEAIQRAVERLADARADLDLRRVEHVLLELRDGQRRLEDVLLRQVERPRPLEGPDAVPGGTPASLAERVTNRLLALGYERVRLVSSLEALEALAASPDGGSGEVVVEARRDGVACKGRVLVRRGALTDVEVRPAYKLFP